MIEDELSRAITETFGFCPTDEQQEAIRTFCRFMTCRDDRPAMVMCGSAGTGKTSLSAAMVKTLARLHQRVVLLAPTGRAAKVLSMNAGMPAFTIHRRIYRQKTFTGDMTGFSLNINKQRDTLFVVDEASMVSNDGFASGGGAPGFGSGCLLDDLMEFVFSGDNCRLMLVGDRAQLPPVGEEESPALMADSLAANYFLTMHSVAKMIELYEQSLEYVKQAENQEVLDFLARRLYDMTADILMSLLIIGDATASPELFAKSAQVYVRYAEEEVIGHSCYVKSFIAEDLVNFRAAE
jgi:hypothetical protein